MALSRIAKHSWYLLCYASRFPHKNIVLANCGSFAISLRERCLWQDKIWDGCITCQRYVKNILFGNDKFWLYAFGQRIGSTLESSLVCVLIFNYGLHLFLPGFPPEAVCGYLIPWKVGVFFHIQATSEKVTNFNFLVIKPKKGTVFLILVL